MIVCSCSRITDTDIHDAISWMRASDAYTLITPGKLYRALGKTPDCGGCIRLFVETMRQNPGLQVPAELRNLRAVRSGDDKDGATPFRRRARRERPARQTDGG